MLSGLQEMLTFRFALPSIFRVGIMGRPERPDVLSIAQMEANAAPESVVDKTSLRTANLTEFLTFTSK